MFLLLEVQSLQILPPWPGLVSCQIRKALGERRRMLIGFLPNKESIRGAWANPMHFNSLRERASEEPSESG